ncbi:MAG: alternative oxidase [Polyangiaceae bacterium]
MTPALLRIADPSSPTPSNLLRQAEREVLASPAPRYGLLASALFQTLALVYGKKPSRELFVVLELVARVPYQAWENVGYVAISHTHKAPAFAQRVFDYVRESRAQQDNEQWHLLITEELAQAHNPERGWLEFRLIPQLLALVYYHISWLLYVLAPELSYALNADFEDHAERTYMRYVAEHPELDSLPWRSELASEYGAYASVADVLRRIALDERVHRDESRARIEHARFELSAAPSALSSPRSRPS